MLDHFHTFKGFSLTAFGNGLVLFGFKIMLLLFAAGNEQIIKSWGAECDGCFDHPKKIAGSTCCWSKRCALLCSAFFMW